MRRVGCGPLVRVAVLLILLHPVDVAPAGDGHPSQDDSSGLNLISISASRSGNEIQIHCSYRAVGVERYNMSFREVGFIIDPNYHPVTIHRHGNGSLLEAWLTLPSHQLASFGSFSCCVEGMRKTTNAMNTLECSDTLSVLPSSGNVSVITRMLNHGDVLDLSTLNCSGEYWLEVNLQGGGLTYHNASRTLDAIITLTHLQQQAKFLCLSEASVNGTAEDNTMEQIVYLLADYEPLHFISPAVNNTIPPPLPSGHRFEYDCIATARPTPRVYWYDDWYPYLQFEQRRKRIPIPNGERLIVMHLQNHLFDVYSIACVAENAWQKEFQWIKYPDIPPSTTRPPTATTATPMIPQPQFNVTITFDPNVCDTRTFSKMVINITGRSYSEIFNYLSFGPRTVAVDGTKLYGNEVIFDQTAYGFVYSTNGTWPVGANGFWEITVHGGGSANTTFTVVEDLVEFNHIPPLIEANVDEVNYVFNVTISAIVHYHDVEFIKDRIKFSMNFSGGAASIFRGLLKDSGSTVCYGRSRTTSVVCNHTLTLNTSRSDIPVNSTGEVQWEVQFWKSPTVSGRNITKLFFGLNPITISASRSGNEIQIHCSYRAVGVERYNMSFREVGFIIDPDYHPVTIHRHGNGSLLEAWLILPSHQLASFGSFSCCAEGMRKTTNAMNTLECSDTLSVLPSSGNVSVITRMLNHGDVLDLSTLNCSEEHWLEVNLQGGGLTYHNASRTLDAIITLTHLQQQAKFLCLSEASVNGTAEDDTVEQIVYLLADYEPIHFISPAVNNTIPPPLPSGHRFEYDCVATAHPTPRVYWYDDWYPYQQFEQRRKRIPIPNGERLIVMHLQNHLFDVYSIACVAENAWQKEFQWIKYPDIPPSTTIPPTTSTATPNVSQPQFNVTITFDPNVCDTRTFSKMVINITGHSYSEIFNYLSFKNRTLNGQYLYGNKVNFVPKAYGFVYSTNGTWPVGANGFWEITVRGRGSANTTFTVVEDLVEFDHVPSLIEANVDEVNNVFNVTVSAIVHYHDVEFIKDRIKFSMNFSGGAASIFRGLLKDSGSTVCYGRSRTTSVVCNHTLTLNTSRSDIPVNSTGDVQWEVQFWKSPTVSSRNVTKLFFGMTPVALPETVPQGNTALRVVVPATAVFLVIGFILIVPMSFLVVRRHLRIKRMQAYYDSFTPVQRMLLKVQLEYRDSGLLYSLEQLQFEEGQLGEGAFGVVRKAQLKMTDTETVTVAVKALKGTATESKLAEFISEFKMLVRIGSHPNIVSLIGAALSVDEERFFILVEFASEGSLLSHLKQMRKEQQTMSWSKGLNFALQIANGMMHLASKECVHCDLAARNILMTADGTLKVSDFGLARKMYYEVYHKNVTSTTRLPLKWMAIESLEEGHEFTTQSDVWSFGVLLWEIATLGGKPYPMVHPRDLLTKLKCLYRMSKPHGCPMNIYTIMRSCWLPLPSQRPTFSQLVAMLDMLLGDYLSASECASIAASQAADSSSEHTGSSINDNQCCQLGEEGMDITGTEYTFGECLTSTGGWYTGESASVGTMTCQDNHSPINRTSANTPSDHTSTYNGGVCEYCSGICQDCMCENSAQMTGMSSAPEYENVDVERDITRNGNLTSAPPLPDYELHSLQANAALVTAELPPFAPMDSYSSADCDNSDMMHTFATDDRFAGDVFTRGLGHCTQHVEHVV